jgi:hypothetical protein
MTSSRFEGKGVAGDLRLPLVPGSSLTTLAQKPSPNARLTATTDMRLLNAETITLEEFFGKKPPSYAILSHVWREEEVTFQDFQRPSASTKKGYEKIRYTCE